MSAPPLGPPTRLGPLRARPALQLMCGSGGPAAEAATPRRTPALRGPSVRTRSETARVLRPAARRSGRPGERPAAPWPGSLQLRGQWVDSKVRCRCQVVRRSPQGARIPCDLNRSPNRSNAAGGGEAPEICGEILKQPTSASRRGGGAPGSARAAGRARKLGQGPRASPLLRPRADPTLFTRARDALHCRHGPQRDLHGKASTEAPDGASSSSSGEPPWGSRSSAARQATSNGRTSTRRGWSKARRATA
jgi:hypothetical protein